MITMGNRAIITLKNDDLERAIYVQWNGGAGSIAGFLRETRRRMGNKDMALSIGDMDNQTDAVKEEAVKLKAAHTVEFYATFYAVAREYFGYCTAFKQESPKSLYMETDASGDGCDNGAYVINDDFTCPRVDIDSLNDEEKNNYNGMEVFYGLVHHALSVVIDDEAFHLKSNDTVEDMRADILAAKEIAENAAARLTRLQERLDKKLMADRAAADQAVKEAEQAKYEKRKGAAPILAEGFN